MISPWSKTTGEKQRCRKRLLECVKEHIPDPVNCFLLPGEECIDAKLIQSEINCRIIGVERDKALFEKISNENRWLHIENSSVQAFIGKHTNSGSVKFDFAFLDYLSWYNGGKQTEINDIVEHLMKPNSILALTFQKSGRGGTEDRNYLIYENAFLEWQNSKANEEWEKENPNTPLNTANAICGGLEKVLHNINVSILEAFEYRANPPKSTPMFFIILKISK